MNIPSSYDFWRCLEHGYSRVLVSKLAAVGEVGSVYFFDFHNRSRQPPIQVWKHREMEPPRDLLGWYWPEELELLAVESPQPLTLDEVLRGLDGSFLLREQSSLDYLLWYAGRAQDRIPESPRARGISLHYRITRNHPFVDGNKRASLVIGAAFLRKNHYDYASRHGQSEEEFEDALYHLTLAAGAGTVHVDTFIAKMHPYVIQSWKNDLFSFGKEHPDLMQRLAQ